jgi:hypothetical protein
MENFNNIKDLLDKVKLIVEKNNIIQQEKKSRGENFNIFNVLGLSSEEVQLHSAFIAELLNVNGNHGMGDEFLKIFLQMIDFKEGFDTESSKTKVEVNIGNKTEERGGRIDILVETKTHQLIIENKIYAVDQYKQLVRYSNYSQKEFKKILYLTLDGKDPHPNSCGCLIKDTDFFCISYKKEILNWLKECAKIAYEKPLARETINQYITLIRQLTNQTMDKNLEDNVIELIAKDVTSYSAALNIKDYVENAQNLIVKKFIKKISEKVKLDIFPTEDISSVENKYNEFGFIYSNYIIYFGEDNGKTYASLKTKASLDGEADMQNKLSLFNNNSDKWNPFGWEVIENSHWANDKNLEIYKDMLVDNSKFEQLIMVWIDKMKKAVESLSNLS